MALVYLPALLANTINSWPLTSPDRPKPPSHTLFGTQQKATDNLSCDSVEKLVACDTGHDVLDPDIHAWVAETTKARSAQIPRTGPSIAIYQDCAYNTSTVYIRISPRAGLLSELGYTTSSKSSVGDARQILDENKHRRDIRTNLSGQSQGTADQLDRTLVRKVAGRSRGSAVRQG